MKRPITAAIIALALTTTAAVAQQPAAKPATQQPAAKPASTTPAPAKTSTKKHKKHAAKSTGAAKMDSTSAKPKN